MKRFFLALIIIISVILRFYELGQNPSSLTWDEVAFGYNAYSFGIDGKDEFGKFLPLDYLESFGDFKPTMYAYLSIFPVKLFGLNAFAVRFPSAFFGVLTVLISYFLVLRIFLSCGTTQNSSVNSGQARNYVGTIALITSFILAISPWHINLSRAAFEANVATFFIVTGVWLFLKGIQSKKWCLILSIAAFVLSVYTFNSTRIVAPLLVLILSIGFRNELIKNKKETLIAVMVGILMILPIFKFLISDQASLRFREVNIFSDLSVIERTNQEILNDDNSKLSKLIHNRRFAYGVEFLKHYFDNLNPDFLFIKGDGNPKFSTQEVGQLYIWEAPFLIAGILYLFKKRNGNWWIVPLWLIVSIIPAATARETPHALRIEAALPTFQILVAYGIVIFLKKISNISRGAKSSFAGQFKILNFKLNRLIFFSFSLLIIFNFLYYIHDYYAHYAKRYSKEWQYGYQDTISYIKNVERNYDKVYFTESLGRAYIYMLFYKNYPPEEFRKNAIIEREVLGFVHVNGFDKYRFAKNVLDLKKVQSEKVLYVDVPENIPEGANIQKKFYLLNGVEVLDAYTL